MMLYRKALEMCKLNLHSGQVAHQAGAYPGFCSMKRPGVFLLPPGWDASPSQGYPQHSPASPRPRLEPGALAPESSALTMRPPRLPLEMCTYENFASWSRALCSCTLLIHFYDWCVFGYSMKHLCKTFRHTPSPFLPFPSTGPIWALRDRRKT